MKNNRYSISIRHALMLLVLLMGLPSSGYALYGDVYIYENVRYEEVGGGVVVIGYSKDAKDLIIPPSIPTRYTWTLPVLEIAACAFKDCTGLTSIKIPNSVTSIGYEVFKGCSSLISIEIPNSVTSIDYYAFEGCSSLTSINIPNSVTSIGGSAFNGCI